MSTILDRSIVALSDDTIAFAVNEYDPSAAAHSSTLIKLNAKGQSQWQRQSDRFNSSVTWGGKQTYQLKSRLRR